MSETDDTTSQRERPDARAPGDAMPTASAEAADAAPRHEEMPVTSPYPQLPLDEALAAVRTRIAALPAVRMPFDRAAGHVLAADVTADEPMPPFPSSSRDGFAVVAADGTGRRTVVGEAVAGTAGDVTVTPGTAARITTGAPLPEGADAVVMIEHTRPEGETVVIERAVAPGAHVRPIGEDYPSDTTLLSAGTPLGAPEIGLLASVGAVEVAVHRRPLVAVLSSGDELVDPNVRPAPGQIRDSNRFALAAAVRAAGAEVVTSGTLRDSEGDTDRLAVAIADADLVITSGGVSMGHRDRIKPWLASHGEIVFGRVRVKPGKPVTFAVVHDTPVLALPGFPVSTLVAFELFARPALRRMGGHPRPERPRWTVRAGHPIQHATDRVELQRAVVAFEDGTPTARTTGFQGSGRLLSLSGANALLRLPAGRGQTAAGSTLTALMLGPVYGDG